VFCHLQGESRQAGELGGKLFRFVHKLLRGDDAVDQTDFIGPLGIQLAAPHNDFLRPAHADKTRQPLCSSPAWDQANEYFRLAETSLVGGEAHIAGHGNLRPAAQGETVDRRDGRLGHCFNEAQGSVAQFHEFHSLLGTHVLHLGYVRPGHEGFVPGARKDDRLDARIRLAAHRCIIELLHRHGIHGVKGLGTIEGYCRYPCFHCKDKILIFHKTYPLCIRHPLWLPILLLLSVIVNAAPDFSTHPASVHILLQQGRGAVFGIAETLV